MKKLIVAIDGPSGAGKSTVGKMLAKELGYLYIDTGAMYRAIGLKAVREGVELKEGRPSGSFARGRKCGLEQADGGVKVYLDNEDVSDSDPHAGDGHGSIRRIGPALRKGEAPGASEETGRGRRGSA